jgi:hypothetical protein
LLSELQNNFTQKVSDLLWNYIRDQDFSDALFGHLNECEKASFIYAANNWKLLAKEKEIEDKEAQFNAASIKDVSDLISLLYKVEKEMSNYTHVLHLLGSNVIDTEKIEKERKKLERIYASKLRNN